MQVSSEVAKPSTAKEEEEKILLLVSFPSPFFVSQSSMFWIPTLIHAFHGITKLTLQRLNCRGITDVEQTDLQVAVLCIQMIIVAFLCHCPWWLLWIDTLVSAAVELYMVLWSYGSPWNTQTDLDGDGGWDFFLCRCDCRRFGETAERSWVLVLAGSNRWLETHEFIWNGLN